MAGSFVGEVPDAATDPFVAIVAPGAAGQEEGEDEREVRAYLCDGEEINEWFWGTTEADELDLTSENGARLTATLAPDASTGTITLEDGASFPFEAELETGVAGLYEVSVSEDGLLRGSSEGGGRLEGRGAEEPNEEGLYPITATDGQSGGKKGVQTKGWGDPTLDRGWFVNEVIG